MDYKNTGALASIVNSVLLIGFQFLSSLLDSLVK